MGVQVDIAPALLVDLDGTVRETLSGRVHPVEPWDQRLRPGVLACLRTWRQHGYRIIGVTNQGGVALGFLSEADVQAINLELSEKLAPGLFDAIYYCPHHPRGHRPGYARSCHCRKPEPGMAKQAATDWQLDLAVSVMVGDMETDRQFAARAGIGRFYWSDEFFAPNVHSGCRVKPEQPPGASQE